MQHVTVIIARKHLDCITMGWSWLLLVKRKTRTNTTATIGVFGHGWKPLMPMHDVVHMDETFRITDSLCEHVSPVSFTCIMELFGVYIKFLRCGSGNLSTFWMSYMDMIDMLLGLIRASREGDWMLRLAYEPWSHGASHMTGWTMHSISHIMTPICLSCTQRTHMCTLNSCKGVFQVKLGSTTPSEESLSIKQSKKRWKRTRRREGDQAVQFETRGCEQILLDRRV